MPKVSVIVPIYKVENYIERCAVSLMEQTLDDIEYLFIDDCSPDHSIKVLRTTLERYPSRHGRVRIISMTSNSGQAAVRRRGIIESTGDYIIHCDSDDWVDVTMYEKMYNAAIANAADIVVCDVVNEYWNKRVYKIYPEISSDPPSALQKIYRTYFDMYTVNKLVKRDLHIQHHLYPFDGINMWEDQGLMYRVFYYARKLVQIRNVYYHYNRCNINAITHCYGNKSINEMIRCAGLLTDFFKGKPEYDKTVAMLQFCAKINVITDQFSGIKTFKRLFSGAENLSKQFDRKAFSKRGRIRLFFVEHHLSWLFILLFKLKNRLS